MNIPDGRVLAKSTGSKVHEESSQYAVAPANPSTHDGITLDAPLAKTSRGSAPSSKLNSIAALKALLSSDNAASQDPIVHTANAIHSVYRGAKTCSHLRRFTPPEFSALISLFGSLSLSTLGNPYHSVFAHPLTARVLSARSGKSSRSYWPLVAEIGRDKHQLYASLGPADHYFVMHAQLAGLSALDGQEHVGGAYYALKGAMLANGPTQSCLPKQSNSSTALTLITCACASRRFTPTPISPICKLSSDIPDGYKKLSNLPQNFSVRCHTWTRIC